MDDPQLPHGEELTIRQEDVQPHGWSVEARVYAEDPNRKFMPSTGRLVRYREPVESDDVRIDSGVYEGGEISMFYDPMISKVTTWGRDRDSAIALMRRALDEFYIKGVHHNIAFLTALMANPRFLQGRLQHRLHRRGIPGRLLRRRRWSRAIWTASSPSPC